MRVKTITLFLCSILIGTTLESLKVTAEENQAQRKFKIDQLIELALEKNPSIPLALSSIDIAKGELRAAKAYPNPDLEFFLARGKSREGNNTDAEFGIAVTQPIEWPLKRHYRRKAAEEEIKAVEFEKEAVKIELIFTTKQLYYSILLAKKDVDLEDELTSPSTIYALENLAQRVADFNPQIKAQETEVKRAGFSILEQKHLRVPDIFLQGFYEREIDRISTGGGVGISIPLWYLNQGGIQSARAQERRASFDLKFLEIEIGNRIEDEYKNYKIAFEQSKIFSGELLDRAKRSLEIAQFSYEQGEIGLLDVLDALRTYRDTLSEYYEVLYEFYISQITLE